MLLPALARAKAKAQQTVCLRACLKTPERGCVVLDQPQSRSRPSNSGAREYSRRAAAQPRSFFRQALNNLKQIGLGLDGHVAFTRIYWRGTTQNSAYPGTYDPVAGYDYRWTGQ